MTSIKEYLTNDHRLCDDIFAKMEQKAGESLEEAYELTKKFVHDMERHFQREERIMFVAFEEKTGMVNGPTEVMRQEHMQMRNIMQQLLKSIQEGDTQKYFGLTETLMIVLQQHNMKEEQMLYTMAQQHLSAQASDIIAQMNALEVQ